MGCSDPTDYFVLAVFTSGRKISHWIARKLRCLVSHTPFGAQKCNPQHLPHHGSVPDLLLQTETIATAAAAAAAAHLSLIHI